MEYDPALNTSLNAVATVETAGLKFYTGGTFTKAVECGSCHDPHSGPTGTNVSKISSTGYYLRKANNTSQLCLTCHK